MKTPVELAIEYADNNFGNSKSYDAGIIISAAEDGFLAGFNEATRWRSVDDEFPELYVKLILKGINKYDGKIRYEIGSYGKKGFLYSSYSCNNFQVTHWRPIY